MSRSKVRLLHGPPNFVKNYELIEHTADVGIRVKGKELKDLFVNAALAMFDIMAQPKSKVPLRLEKVKVTQEADTLEDLFIGWLNELLSLSATKEIVFSSFNIILLGQHNIEAEALGGHFKDFAIEKEIKAATYHQLKVEQTDSGWIAEVILDV